MNNTKIGSIIAFENDKTYVVFDSIIEGDTEYLYMATTSEPLEIMFAKKPVDASGETDIVTIGDKAEKDKVLSFLIEKSKSNNSQK